MSTHTPGPWLVDDYLSRAHDGYEEGTRCITTTDGVLVALTARGGKVVRHENDAKLIASAPDMLAALQDVLARIEDVNQWWMNEPTKGGLDVKMIRAAVARAAVRRKP